MRQCDRDLVERLSSVQRTKLTEKEHRYAEAQWRRDPVAGLLSRFEEEIHELRVAIAAGHLPREVWREAADVANYAAMIAERYEILAGTPDA